MPRGLQLDYKEFSTDGGSPNESFGPEQTTATRVLDVDWSDRFLAAAQLMGFSRINDTDPQHWTIDRYLPDVHPEQPVLICTEVKGKGIGTAGSKTVGGRKVNIFLKARLTCTYTFPDYDVLENSEITTEFDRFRTFEAKPSAEYLSPPVGSGFLTWAEGDNFGDAFPGNVGFIYGTTTLFYRWLQVPFAGLPEVTIQDTIGRVNADTFAGNDPGTLLLLGWDPKRTNSPHGLRTWNVGLTMVRNMRGWNNFYNFQTQKWEQATTDGLYYSPGDNVPDGKYLYDERNFADLFDVNMP
jgi:hypothetical protein